MRESANLPMNFGGIDDIRYSAFDFSQVIVLPVAYEGAFSYGAGTGSGAAAIIDASRNLELYEEETDAEVYKIGIHTLAEFAARENPEQTMSALYEQTRKLIAGEKFLCLIGGEHSISAPAVRAHAERHHNLSVLQIDARADLRDEYDGTKHSHTSVMARIVKDWRIPAVQVGIRSLSAGEARLLDEGIPTKIYWAKDIVERTDWIDSAISALTENVYLTIDVDGFDPSLMPTTGTPEPGGLGWYEVLALINRLAGKRRIVGMDLVEYAHAENFSAPAFTCAKLIYKTLGYIFRHDTPKVRRK